MLSPVHAQTGRQWMRPTLFALACLTALLAALDVLGHAGSGPGNHLSLGVSAGHASSAEHDAAHSAQLTPAHPDDAQLDCQAILSSGTATPTGVTCGPVITADVATGADALLVAGTRGPPARGLVVATLSVSRR